MDILLKYLNPILLSGVGYFVYRGKPLINRRIHGDETANNAINVDDTRGKAIMDTNWPYSIRDQSLKSLEATCQPIKPLTARKLVKPPTNNKELDVIIIGGAAAGLSCAAWSEKAGLSYLVFEKNENVSDIWMSRYHRLHLHDIIELCHLPFHDMPQTYPVFPSREEFAKYLESYKSILNLKVATRHIVRSAFRISKSDANSGWIVTAEDLSNNSQQQYKCKHLIMANGVYHDPKVEISNINMDKFSGLIVHSCKYTNGTDLSLRNKSVLIVGWGNSGSEIALDLLEHGAKPTLLVRSGQVVIPHSIMMQIEAFAVTHLIPMLEYVPFSFLLLIPYLCLFDIYYKVKCRLYYGELSKYGIMVHKKGLIARFLQDDIAPLQDVGTICAVKEGNIKVINSEIKRFNDNGYDIEFKNGATQRFDAVVLATGYHMFNSHKYWLEKEAQKRIGFGMQGLKDNKMNPGSNFKQCGLQTLWYVWGNLIMIKHASKMCVTKISDQIRKDNKYKRQNIWFWVKQIFKHIVALMFIINVWYWYKSKSN